MQVKPIPTVPVAASAELAVFKPLRLNFAQVCLYCGSRWCASPLCIEQHAASVWAVCPDCDGFGPMANCVGCTNGVVEVGPAAAAEQLGRVLPDTAPDADCYVASAGV